MLLQGAETLEMAEALSLAYATVFTSPPWNQVHDTGFDATAREFDDRLHLDAHRPGFRAAVAETEFDEIEGFATGWFTQFPFRTDRAYHKVTALLGPQRVDELLSDSMEVDEVAVVPDARGTGLGRRLLTTLLKAAPHGRAWLLTWHGAPGTVAFYRHLGWYEVPAVPGYNDDIVVFLAPTHPAAQGLHG